MKDDNMEKCWFCTSCQQIFDIDHPDIKFLQSPDANHALIEHERRAHNLIFTTNKAIRDRMELENHARPVSPQNRLAIAKELDAQEAVTSREPTSLEAVFESLGLGETDGEC